MKISRIDLDGCGSPSALVTRILKIEPDLPIPVPVEELCASFDIIRIDELTTQGFEAALLTDVNKSNSAILLAKGGSRQRRRYSIAHELGHFLIPTHMPDPSGQILCSASDLLAFGTKEQDKRKRMEVEANQFAALLLMPPSVLRSELAKAGTPDLASFLALAELFAVSKQAMARPFVFYQREAVAIIQVRDGKVVGSYRDANKFPWIDVARHSPVPRGSSFHDAPAHPGSISHAVDRAPELWLGADGARKVGAMTEQLLWQQNGYAMIMLHADMVDGEDDDGHYRRDARWRWR